MITLRFQKITLDKTKVITFLHRKYLSSLDVSREEQDAKCYGGVNRSGLLNQHRNILHNITPYKEPSSWIHLREKYQRKVFGRYGSESGVNSRICFPQTLEIKSLDRYEKLNEPETLQSMISKSKQQKKHKLDEINKREDEIEKKIDKLDQWKQELYSRVMKKEADAIAAKQRKERLIEEVRRHFGYKVDPRDERFKEVLEQKEREDKKKQKEAKRQAKEQKLMSKLVGAPTSKK